MRTYVAHVGNSRDLSVFCYVSLGTNTAAVSARRRAAAGTGTGTAGGTSRTGSGRGSTGARAGNR